MKSQFRTLGAALLLGILAVGCGQPRINARTAETYRTSLETMRTSLSAAERVKLDAAVAAIFAAGRERQARFGGGGMGDQSIMMSLDEKTAAEIIAAAAGIEARKKH